MSGEPAESKVVILFKQTGDAPILKQNKVKAPPIQPSTHKPADFETLQISGHDPFSKLVDFLRKKLGRDQVFVYLKEAFCPSLEERVQTLYDAFGVDGRLVVNYALTPAWG